MDREVLQPEYLKAFKRIGIAEIMMEIVRAAHRIMVIAMAYGTMVTAMCMAVSLVEIVAMDLTEM